jgi:phosphoribosylformylglycinamidine synthase
MAPFEVMISESQERMLAVVLPDRLGDVLGVCGRWGIPAAVIGTVTGDGFVRVVSDGEELAAIPAAALTSDAIVHRRLSQPPARRRAAPAPGVPETAHDGLPERGMDPGAVLLALLSSPNVGSRAWVTTQYDSTVGSDTVEGNEHGAAVLRVKGTQKGLVAATDAQAGVAALDPYLGAALAVAECSRNVAVTGARPLGVTNCLNFGNPEIPERYWQLAESVRGIADACVALGLPVTGGNVSLYNESGSGAIAPTAQIGVVGLLDDVAAHVPPRFRREGDIVAVLGEASPGLAGSEYAALAGVAPEDGPPALDLAREAALQRLLVEAATARLLSSAHDVSGGGLAVAAAESAMWSGLGADLVVPVGTAPAVELFGESPSRAVVSLHPADWPALEQLAAEHAVPLRRLGQVGGERLVVELVGRGATGANEERGGGVADAIDLPLTELLHAWRAALPRALGEEWVA